MGAATRHLPVTDPQEAHVYDMNSEWDRYMLRYDGYSAQTLEGFVAEGKATHDGEGKSTRRRRPRVLHGHQHLRDARGAR